MNIGECSKCGKNLELIVLQCSHELCRSCAKIGCLICLDFSTDSDSNNSKNSKNSKNSDNSDNSDCNNPNKWKLDNIWLYSGNKTGYWVFDKSYQKDIERNYINYKTDNSKNNYELSIGKMKVILNFMTMKQISLNNNTLRNIKRINKSELDSVTIKGIAGKAL